MELATRQPAGGKRVRRMGMLVGEGWKGGRGIFVSELRYASIPSPLCNTGMGLWMREAEQEKGSEKTRDVLL